NCDRTGFHPAECLYETADGWIAVAARSENMAASLANVLGLEGKLGSRTNWAEKERLELAASIRLHLTEPLLRRLSTAGVWAERCTTDGWKALPENPTAGSADLVVRLDHPRYGAIKTVGPLVNFSRSTLRANRDRTVPDIGEHTKE